jgi:hypothetical protein
MYRTFAPCSSSCCFLQAWPGLQDSVTVTFAVVVPGEM